MKILWLSHEMGLGGANKCLAEQIKILADEGYDISVIVLRKGPFANYVAKDVTAIHEVYFYHWIVGLGQKLKAGLRLKMLMRNFVAVLKILRIIIKTRPYYVVTNTTTMSVAAVAAKISNTKHVWFIHEFSEEDHGNQIFCGFKKGAKLINWLSTKVVFNSEAVKHKYLKYIRKDKIYIAHNPVVLPDTPIPEKMTERYIQGVRPLSCVILGQIAPSKNQLEALKAIQKIISNGEFDIHLKIIGNVVNEQYLERIIDFIKNNSISGKVEIVDYVNNPIDFINAADALLMCSRMEAFGRVTVEALKIGVPVIAANSGGSPEIVTDGINGYLYEAGNAENLAEMITKLSRNYSKFEYIEIAKQMNEKFNEEKTKKQLTKIFS